MTHHWNTLLTTTLHHPDTPLTTHVTDHPAAARIWAGGSASLTERFAVAASRHAGAVAVRDDRDRLDYATLHARSNQVAHLLMNLGVVRGDRVGLHAAPDVALTVAILGILKSGAAYVPIDPRDPAPRAVRLFAEAGVRLVIGDADLPGRASPIVSLHRESECLNALPTGDPDLTVLPGDPAYVIYTSGSTGAPKGVEVTHGNVIALLDATVGRFGFGPHDTWTLFHSAAFDFSVWELWGALLNGGQLVVVPPEVARSPNAFARLLGAHGVTVLNQTPLAFAQLVDALRAEPVELSLRTVILGGAALEPELVRRWFTVAAAQGPRLYNMYGTTETTVHATVHEIGPLGTEFTSSLIGTPLPHQSVTVRGRNGELVPVGVPGELWIGGPGVARGYLGRPGLTAERFTPDPADAGGRPLYRTGDRARWRPDGLLEFLGRMDDQVKVRGYRVELAEVTATLAAHPQVRECVVVLQGHPAGDRLVAYVAVGERVTGGELREFVAGRLPEYMVPAHVVLVDALPRTTGGKLDRSALPVPVVEADERTAGYIGPRTEAERVLVAVLSEVLSVERISVHDNLFELGGDSIRSVMIAARLRADGWWLSVETLFAHPTVGAAARHLRPMTPEQVGPDTPQRGTFAMLDCAAQTRVPDGVVDAYPMTATQLAMVYHMELEPQRRPYHNVTSYRIRANLAEDAFRDVVAEAIARHAVLRTSFDLTSFDEPMQLVWARAAPDPLTVHDLRGVADGSQREALVAALVWERARPFAPSDRPLLRIQVHLLSDDEFQLTVTDHHAILDGWSFTSLVAELLVEHHRRRTIGSGAPASPATGSTFGDFVAAERRAASDPIASAFWRDRLDGVDGRMFAEPQRSGVDFDVSELTLTDELCAGVKALADLLGVGVKTVVLGAHVAALAAVTGRTAVTTGITVTGRLEEPGGTETLGMFLNTVPLNVTVGSDWTTLLRRLHADETAVLRHRRVPFARLARYLCHPRLDVGFAFNRFHRLQALCGEVGEIVDDRIGSMPALRWEPDFFSLTAAVIQDPRSDRILLEVTTDPSSVPERIAAGYRSRFVQALAAMVADPHGISA